MSGPELAGHPSRRVCTFCRTRLDVHQAVRGGVCGSRVCRGRHLQELAKQRLARQAEVRREAAAFRAGIGSSLGMTDPEALTLAVVPYFDRAIVKLPQQRRRNARAHLARIVREAFELPPGKNEADGPSVAIEQSPTLRHGEASCATCRGSCCRGGDTHAYLDAGAVRSYRAQHPGLGQREVLKAFLEAIPGMTFERSCVYHGRHGCALPREMRSATCNRFQCAGLTELRNALAESVSRQVLIVSASDNALESSTLVQQDGTTVRVRWAGRIPVRRAPTA